MNQDLGRKIGLLRSSSTNIQKAFKNQLKAI